MRHRSLLGAFRRLRGDPRPSGPCRQTRPVRLLALGDVFLRAEACTNPELALEDVSGLRPHLARADLVVANLEGPITTHSLPVAPDKPVNLCMPPGAAAALGEAGVDLLSIANNHVMDHGAPGLLDTIAALSARGIRVVGAGPTLDAAASGVVIEVAGVRMGWLAFMEDYPAYRRRFPAFADATRAGVAPLTRAVVRPALRRLRPKVDLLAISVHWGIDYAPVAPTQRTWGRQLAAYGADLVLGHHPHVVQGATLEYGVPVLYSLGNGLYHGGTRMHTAAPGRRFGWMAEVVLERGRIEHVALCPLEVDPRTTGTRPRPARPERLPTILAALEADSATPLRIQDGRAVLRDYSPRRRRREKR